jgi:hypothetical protein
MTDAEILKQAFETVGARLKFGFADGPDQWNRSVIVDVKKDRKGEYFDIRADRMVELRILDMAPKDRHLLLLARDPNNPKAKFLCGHDERHWFIAAIPEKSPVSTVTEAKQALKPKELVEIESSRGVKPSDLHKRRRRTKSSGKILRQGEFVFVPEPDFQPTLDAVHRNEMLARGGNPHTADYLYREGGTKVYISHQHPDGITEEEYERFLKDKPEAKRWGWRVQVRNPTVYVKGRIRHPEHATLNLRSTWHRVIPNTEAAAKASVNVAFID